MSKSKSIRKKKESQGTLVDMSLIVPGNNDRTVFKEEDIKSLAENIKENGLIHPITVRWIEDADLYQIVEGERRFRACSLLGWKKLPATIKDLTDEEASSIMLAENVARADLDPIDEGEAYAKRINSFGWSVEECARCASVSVVRVQFRLKLLRLLPELRQLVRGGHFPVGYAQTMADANLDNAFQMMAFAQYRDNLNPTVPWFRRVVGELFEKQAQGVMFASPLFDGQCSTQVSGAGALQLPPDPAKDYPPMTGKTAKEKIENQLDFWRSAAEAWDNLGKPFKRQECQAAVRVLQFTLGGV